MQHPRCQTNPDVTCCWPVISPGFGVGGVSVGTPRGCGPRGVLVMLVVLVLVLVLVLVVWVVVI